eukprot:768344-Hanusia_phi.AAC.3
MRESTGSSWTISISSKPETSRVTSRGLLSSAHFSSSDPNFVLAKTLRDNVLEMHESGEAYVGTAKPIKADVVL